MAAPTPLLSEAFRSTLPGYAPTPKADFSLAGGQVLDQPKADFSLEGGQVLDSPQADFSLEGGVVIDQPGVYTPGQIKAMSKDEVLKLKDFNPELFGVEHFDTLQQDMDVQDKVLAAYRQRATRGTSFKEKAKSFFTGLPEVVGALKSGAVAAAKTSFNLTPGMIGNRRPEETLATMAEVPASVETAVEGAVDLLRRSGREVAEGVTGAKASMSDEDWTSRYLTDVKRARMSQDAGKGNGRVMTALGTDAETLATHGITLDTQNIQDLSVVTDPINYIPVGAAVGAVTKIGGKLTQVAIARTGTAAQAARLAKTLNNATTLAAKAGSGTVQGAGTVVEKLGEGVTAMGGAAEKGVRAVGGTASGLGLGGILGGDVYAALGGAAIAKGAPRVAQAVGRGVSSVGSAIKSPLGSATISGAAAGFAKGTAEGLVLTLPFEIGARPDEERFLLGAAALGGVARGTIEGSAPGARVAGRAAQNKLAESIFKRVEQLDRESAPYGEFPELDALNATESAKRSPQERALLNAVRELVRDAGTGETQIYMVSPAEMKTRTGHEARGYTIQIGERVMPDGSSKPVVQVFLNSSTEALPHELKHVLETLAPEESKALDAQIAKELTPEQLASFEAKYNSMMNGGAPESAWGYRLSKEKVLGEVSAEIFSRLLLSQDLTGVSPTVQQKAALFTSRILEKLGAPLGGMNLPRSKAGVSTLGIRPSAETTAFGKTWLSDLLARLNEDGTLGEPIRRTPLDPDYKYKPARPDVGQIVPVPKPPVIASVDADAPYRPPGSPVVAQAPVTPVEPTPSTPPPVETPSAVPPAAPTPTPPPSGGSAPFPIVPDEPRNIRTTRGAQDDFSAQRAEVTNIGAAREAAQKAGDEATIQAVEGLSPAVERGGVVEIIHSGVTTDKTAEGRTSRRSAQEAAYIAEGLAAAPASIRTAYQKVFTPVRWEVVAGRPQLIAMSLDKVIANVHRTVSDVVKAKAEAKVPYEIVDGKLTDNAWGQFVDDLQTYTENQQNGYRGDGQKLTRPTEDVGLSIPAENTNFSPRPLTEERMNFLNMVQGLNPPLTARVGKQSSAVKPGNVKGQILAEVNRRTPEKPTVIRAKDIAKQTFDDGRIVMETNPLRNELTALGVAVRELIEVTERINAKDIQSWKARPDLDFKAPVTDTIRGGFLPADPTTANRAPASIELADSMSPEDIARDAAEVKRQLAAYPKPDPAMMSLPLPERTAAYEKYSAGKTALALRAYNLEEAGLIQQARQTPKNIDSEFIADDKKSVDKEISKREVQKLERDIDKDFTGTKIKWDGEGYAVNLRPRAKEAFQKSAAEHGLEFVSKDPNRVIEGGGFDYGYLRRKGRNFSNPDLAFELEKIVSGASDGVTLNADGSVFNPGDQKLDVVTLASKNIPLSELSVDSVQKAFADYDDLLSLPGAKPGVFKLSKQPKVSLDLNVVVDQKFRDNTLKFARANNQESVFDLVNFETVETGGDGNTVLTDPAKIAEAASKLLRGEEALPSGQFLPKTESGKKFSKDGFSFGKEFEDDFQRLFVKKDGQTVATLEYYRDGQNSKLAHLSALEVAPKFRGRGLGEAVLREVAKDLQSQKVSRVLSTPLHQTSFDMLKRVFGDFDFVGDDIRKMTVEEARTQLPKLPPPDKDFVNPPQKVEVSNIVRKDAQFLPKTEAGKRLIEDGYELKYTDSGGGTHDLNLIDDSKTVGGISAHFVRPEEAQIGIVEIEKEHRGGGVGEALYRELLTQLRDRGVTKVSGSMVSGAPLAIRKKIFGVVEGLKERDWSDSTGHRMPDLKSVDIDTALTKFREFDARGGGYNVKGFNTITPEMQFLPSDNPRAVKRAAMLDDNTGEIYEGVAHFAALREALDAGANEDALIDGFVTNDGEFLTREQAMQRAVEIKQLNPKDYQREIESYQVEPGEGNFFSPTRLESYTFGETRQFLPGDVKRKKSADIDSPNFDYETWAKAAGLRADDVKSKSKSKSSVSKSIGQAAWILPDGELEPLTGNAFHEENLASNSARYNKKFGTDFSDRSTTADRIKAVNAGFVRLRKEAGRGLMVEASAERWSPSLRSKIRRVLLADADSLTFVHLDLLNKRGNSLYSDSTNLAGKPDRGVALEEFLQDFRSGQQFLPADVFYSELQKVIADKVSGKTVKTSDLNSLLRNSGVKAEEIKWSGLDDFLKGEESVSKTELLDYLKANDVRLGEVVKGGEVPENRRTEFDEDSESWSIIDERGDVVEGGFMSERAAERAILTDAARDGTKSAGGVKYENYQVPGGENYREMLLTLPERQPVKYDLTNVKWNQEESTARDGGRYFIIDAPGQTFQLPKSKWSTAREAINYVITHKQPSLDLSKNFKSSHFDEPNVLAHVRFNERRDSAGNKVLFLEEVQSDWHQKGKKEGYAQEAPLPDVSSYKVVTEGKNDFTGQRDIVIQDPSGDRVQSRSGFRGTDQEALASFAQDLQKQDSRGSVPDVPFKKTWPLLAVKRMIRYAAENGFDKLAWTPGDVQAARYDLSKEVGRIDWNESRNFLTAYDHEGEVKVSRPSVTREELPKIVGEELTKKLLASESFNSTPYDVAVNKTFSVEGDSLKVGGEGMRGFYDKILPAEVGSYVKKWGSKVEKIDLSQNHDASNNQPFKDRNKALRVLESGGEIYAKFKNNAGEDLVTSYNQLLELEQEYGGSFAKEYYLGDKQPKIDAWSLPITPQMRSDVLSVGQKQFLPNGVGRAPTMLNVSPKDVRSQRVVAPKRDDDE